MTTEEPDFMKYVDTSIIGWKIKEGTPIEISDKIKSYQQKIIDSYKK